MFKNVKIRLYRTVILPVVLYAWEAWSLVLREEHTHILHGFQVRMIVGYGISHTATKIHIPYN
jgi:hypothetical protein